MPAATVIPGRHPAQPRPVPPGVGVFSALLGLRGPTPEQFRRMGEALMAGDEPMDRLVEWIHAVDTDVRRAQFERALASGIDSVADAPEPLREFFEQVETVPDWVDWDTLRTAAEVMRSGGEDGLYLARDVSLLGGYMYAGFNQTLLRTGALEKGSNRRFAETTRWALDVIAEGGLLPGGVGYRSTLRVRFIHSLVRRHLLARPDWDTAELGLPINQTDMASTLVGALIAPSASSVGLGLFFTPREYESVAHLTRYVGTLMGVTDEFLPRSFRDSVRVLLHTSCALATPDETSRLLAAPIADDPLTWNYPSLQVMRRRVARSQHLSIATAFLGRGAMRTLGLPTTVLPWYPVVRLPVNVCRSIRGMLPGGRAAAAAAGLRRQEMFIRTMVPDEATIGHSAAALTG
ncbi:oxygenase MpaB family protein [Tsukamurella soli]|uniref:Oxygenase MpaB family protein n=1 Tax=Tsukamurella soli TaxID=644556 RepID=A0ABP8J204_9ACTN